VSATLCTSQSWYKELLRAEQLWPESEDLEDRSEDGNAAIAGRHITDLDVVVGITAEQRLLFMALLKQRDKEEQQRSLLPVPIAQVSADCDIDIRLVGPEVLAGLLG